ncbi:MAG: 4-hydroxy-3-methylbut-2-enyl diphosphate reductase [Thiovulaceae bacterium]|nr:4-hydroxy-3-methylbut-2-enyl diphosphate reductase [Sulfurimonadaceae bacterium]
MKIKLAENYGFCFGVKRAIKMAENEHGAATYGPLIHNNKEIDRLKVNFDVSLKNDLSEFESADKVIIRTHGIEKNELQVLNDKKVNIVDATCPYVTKPQQIVEEMSLKGYDIVIFGDEEHPEIKGVKSYAQGNVYVVLTQDELELIPLREKIAVVAQTTRKIENYLTLVNHLITHHKEVRVFNTICNATFENQDAARALAKEADVMIVIGGKNSSNTKQLLSIAKESCKDSFLIESSEDLDLTWFKDKKLCGITAGASTPDWIIMDVTQQIKNI